MRIEILCGGGSPDGVHLSDIYGKNGRVGVGGAELALLTMCEGWTARGYEVILYNNPKRQDGVFEQRSVADFDHTDKRGDVVIFFREPNPRVVGIRRSKKIFWSCDQYTVGDFKLFSTFVDKVVTISPYHSRYFKDRYAIENSIPIDLPVRTWDYEKPVEKVSHRLIFTSVPDRGLQYVATAFPKIKEQIPDASLVITSDYRLWGATSPMNSQFLPMFLRMKDVELLGAVPRERLVEEQLKAEIHFYPCIYEELFCIAVAESQVAGALPITTDMGALATTNMGVVFHESMSESLLNNFAETTVAYLKNPDLSIHQKSVQEIALRRFRIDNILNQWDKKVFNG